MKIEEYCTKIEQRMMKVSRHRDNLLPIIGDILKNSEEVESDDGMCFQIPAQMIHDLQQEYDLIMEDL